MNNNICKKQPNTSQRLMAICEDPDRRSASWNTGNLFSNEGEFWSAQFFKTSEIETLQNALWRETNLAA
jgi:hypothetical protein